MNKTVKCPSCKTLVEWSEESIYRPFCSERCRLIDLGEWASENHAIPGTQLETEMDIQDEQVFIDESQY